MAKIGIIDYGMGNLRSVQKGMEKAGHQASILRWKDALPQFDGIILPGVGAFGDAVKNLRNFGLFEAIIDYVLSGGILLGICLGMQLLFEFSEEHGRHEGLGIIPGSVTRLPSEVKVPHMGWNILKIKREAPLLAGIEDGARFYFVHSYRCVPEFERDIVAVTPYGEDFVSVVARDNVMGLQFHPEKSSGLGLRILSNFGAIAESKRNTVRSD